MDAAAPDRDGILAIVPEPPNPPPVSASALRIVPVTEVTVEDWRHVHNIVIHTTPLTRAEVRERAGRYRLTVAYAGSDLIGCATVRPPGDAGNVTVIVRVLPEHRGHGYGREIFAQAMEAARDLGGASIETIVLASNLDGLRFALRHGFVEVARHLPHDAEVPFITLRRA